MSKDSSKGKDQVQQGTGTPKAQTHGGSKSAGASLMITYGSNGSFGTVRHLIARKIAESLGEKCGDLP